jgi:hypothetical protein
MEGVDHGVLVKIGVERYLVPWGLVQTARFEDAPAPGEVGGGPLTLALAKGITNEQLAEVASMPSAIRSATLDALETKSNVPKGGRKQR